MAVFLSPVCLSASGDRYYAPIVLGRKTIKLKKYKVELFAISLEAASSTPMSRLWGMMR